MSCHRSLPRGSSPKGLDLLENPSGADHAIRQPKRSAARTEPDENTYLILDHNPGGPTPGYDYGRHFLFQGHEMPNGNTNRLTSRASILMWRSPDHRITLMTPGRHEWLDRIQQHRWFNLGSVQSQPLLFTQEDGAIGGVIEMGADFDPNTGGGAGLRTLYGSLGRGGLRRHSS